MGNDKQIQKAGDNSNQLQTGDVYITTGISERRVREICSEVAAKAIADNSLESSGKAMERIERFIDLLLPRIQRIEKDFDSFSDPAFQVLLRKAQITSACTERENDYSVLSELLVHRIKNKSDIKRKASIHKAVEIIDQVDDDSLCAITMYHAIQTFIPVSGNISQGIKTLSDLYEKINPDELPKDNFWMDNLSILGAITIIPFSARDTYLDILCKQLEGYVCVGIKKDSEAYSKAIERLNENNLNPSILVDNELLEGYARLELPEKRKIEDLGYLKFEITNGAPKTIKVSLTEKQKQCLYEIFGLYVKDDMLLNTVKTNLKKLIDSFEPMRKAVLWWNNLSIDIRTTSIGRVIAHTNAKRIDSSLPDLD